MSPAPSGSPSAAVQTATYNDPSARPRSRSPQTRPGGAKLTAVAETPAKATAEHYRQAYNVAASRARDQLWLFSSVALEDLKPGDLRTSLMSYMLQPPSAFGVSPAVEEVTETAREMPFESLFEQRVFREIPSRGYHVVPQYPVGARRLDLVVVGDGSR